jgi:transposase
MMTTQITKPDFTGQELFVGIDVAKNSWKVCILTQHVEHRTFTQPPKPEVLVGYLQRHFPGAHYHCAYEAGYCGFWIHDGLKALGVDCIVVNPADVPSIHKERTFKTDRIDARKLARALRNGELTPVYVPNRAALEDRSLVRTRYSLVRKQTRCKNQIKGLLSFYGIPLPQEPSTVNWSKRFILWLEQLTLQSPNGTLALKALIQELKYLRQMIAESTKQIRALANEPPYCSYTVFLITIPGISTLAAMILLTELITLSRFRTLDHLSSYVGLVPGEYSSGEREITTGISPRRNPFLRGLIIECAWVAVRKDPALVLAFNKLCTRMPKHQAIIRIAHKLLNRIRFVLKHQTSYVPAVV